MLGYRSIFNKFLEDFNMKNKRLLSVLTAVLTATSLVSSVSVCADSTSRIVYESEGYAKGLRPMDEEEYEAFMQTLVFDNEYTRNANTRASLPSSVDLSTSKYFPAIGDQGNYNSCVAWATTYYQFTYEVNKLHNTTATPSTTYSPAWTWNYDNGSANYGISTYTAHKILEQRGATTIDVMPYNNNNYDFSWVTDQDDLLKALSIRKTSTTDTVSVPGTGTSVTSNKDTDLNALKTALNSGKVLTVSTNMAYNAKLSEDSEVVIYRFCNTTEDLGHELAVVGYDDNICCDVNNNGTIEASEKGALKIANSWGTGWGNAGYVWVLYDALNEVSANTTNSWENSLSGERKSAFSYGLNENNLFYAINVEDRDLNFVGRFDLTTNYRNLVAFTIFLNSNSIEMYSPASTDSSSNVSAFSGPILVDFGNCPGGDDPYSFYNGNTWRIRLHGGRDLWQTSTSQFKMIDNKGNVISDFGSISSSMYNIQKTINLQKGDLNFDGTVDISDLATLTQYVNGGEDNLSNVAKCLADFDNNKIVNSTDLNTLSNMLLGRSIV